MKFSCEAFFLSPQSIQLIIKVDKRQSTKPAQALDTPGFESL